MKKGIIVGKDQRSYEKDGQTKFARTLHVLWDAPEQHQEGSVGQKVEAAFIRFPIDNISVGDYCGFNYEVEPGFQGMRAVLTDIKVLGKAKMTVELPKVAQ